MEVGGANSFLSAPPKPLLFQAWPILQGELIEAVSGKKTLLPIQSPFPLEGFAGVDPLIQPL